MAVDHYENFPVASVLLPARLRPAVEAIYAFARGADDIADEGDAPPEQRLAALEEYEQALDVIAAGGVPGKPQFARLAEVIEQFKLPLRPLRDLLSAFRQDVVKKEYARYEDLIDYCRRSANPVGILMLELYGAADEASVRRSNAICTALQLINFWQDVAIDLTKPRLYLPLEDLERFGVTREQLARGEADARWCAMMQFEVERARALMMSGAPLARRLPGRIGWELRLVVQGGLRILERIEAVDYDVFRRRPSLGPADWSAMAWRSIFMRA